MVFRRSKVVLSILMLGDVEAPAGRGMSDMWQVARADGGKAVSDGAEVVEVESCNPSLVI